MTDEKIKIGYDDNLGLPNDFANAISCETFAFHDLEKLIQAFKENKVTAIFAPAGALPYIEKYDVISQAVMNAENNTLTSKLVTTKDISLIDIPNCTFGRVNKYCTTSFWSPLIYLMEKFPPQTTLTFKETNGFPDLLHKTAMEALDCCMIWDIILKQHSKDANKVHTLFQKTDLPTPVILSHPNFNKMIKEKINTFITEDTNAFFKGFTAPNLDFLQAFITAMKKAKNYFNLQLIH